MIDIIMGSTSDWIVLQEAAILFKQLDVSFEARIISAHRTPERLYTYAHGVEKRGIKAIIAGAGGAAHLPGMVASLTSIPVLGVPIPGEALKGIDSLLSMVQMPAGIPVATFAIGKTGAKNAALFACALLALQEKRYHEILSRFRVQQTDEVPLYPPMGG